MSGTIKLNEGIEGADVRDALKWRYDMEDVEQAAKIDFSKIPTPAITLKLEDVLPLKQINKGRKASEKMGIVAFKYGKGKAIIYLADEYGANLLKLAEINAEGKGEGVALYNLVLLEKLLKDAKSGFMRIEEDRPLKLNIRTGRKTKAVLYLLSLLNSDLTEEIRQTKAELDRIQEQEQIEQEKRKPTAEADAKKFLERLNEVANADAVKRGEEYKEAVVRKEVKKEGVSFLTIHEPSALAYHNSKEVYGDMKAEAQIDRECLWVLHLVGGKVLKKELVAMGKGNAVYTTPREIFRRAIIEGTTKIILVHNHPSGDPTPSDSDIEVCETYVNAGKMLGIGLLDFLVIGTQGYTSFADKGLGGLL